MIPSFSKCRFICLLLIVLLASSATRAANPPVGNPPLSVSPTSPPEKPVDDSGDEDTSTDDDSSDDGPQLCSVVAGILVGTPLEGLGSTHLRIEQLQPGPNLVSPANFHFTSPINTSILSTGSSNLPSGV